MEVLLYPNDTLDQTVEEFDFENNDLFGLGGVWKN